MTGILSTLREMLRRSEEAANANSRQVEKLTVPRLASVPLDLTASAKNADPLDRERIIGEQLAELSDSLSIRYRQVCRDLRDMSRLAWNSDAHEIRDILAHVLRTLAPTDDVISQEWFKLVEGTDGPTHAQRARYVLSQSRSQSDAKVIVDEVEVVEALISRIARSTYSAGSRLAHNRATHQDCILLLLHFDALMFSLLSPGTAESGTPRER